MINRYKIINSELVPAPLSFFDRHAVYLADTFFPSRLPTIVIVSREVYDYYKGYNNTLEQELTKHLYHLEKDLDAQTNPINHDF